MSKPQDYLPVLSAKQKTWIKSGDLAKKLLTWYDQHRRPLPWRSISDPYKIWLSEVILQQTRVAQGMDYYHRIVKAFPKVEDLAVASEREVLALWQGLGYYRRALNLHACAQKVVANYHGQFPTTYQELLTLPGIGPYTAAAIASIAFEESVAVVDGNVYRVLARLFGMEQNIALPAAKKSFQALAEYLLPATRVGDYNQAVMEFGALFCTPAKPSCATCVFQNHCVAYHQEKQHLLPVKEKKINIKHRFFHYLILQKEDQFYLQRRTGKDIWKGLYQFYLVEENEKREFSGMQDPLAAQLKKYTADFSQYPVTYQHQLTHQRLHISFFHARLDDGVIPHIASLLKEARLDTFTFEEIIKLPLPITLARFVREALPTLK